MVTAVRNNAEALNAEPIGRRGIATLRAVAFELAERYRADRGYVDETVNQLAGALMLKPKTVRNCLSILNQIGWWVVVPGHHGGSKDFGTRRVPGPNLVPEAGPALKTWSRKNQNLVPEESKPGPGTGTQPLIPINPPPAAEVVDNFRSGLQKRRRGEIAKQYAQIAVTRSKTPIHSFDGFVESKVQLALNDPRLDTWLERWPDAPASAVAAWLHGDTHSMQYFAEAVPA
jgi:hypothetical protein